MEDLLDKDLQDILGRNKSRYQKATKTARERLYDEVDSTWFPTYRKSFLSKLKDVVLTSLFPLGVYVVFFYWMQTGKMDSSVASAAMAGSMAVMGFRIGNVLRMN